MRFFCMRDADRLIFCAAISKNFSSFCSASVAGCGGGGFGHTGFGVGVSPVTKQWTNCEFQPHVMHKLTQNNVDETILHQRHEHENCTNWHKRIDSFQIWDGWQTRLRFCMLCRECENGCDAECDACRRSFGLYPKGYPWHDDDETCGNVSVK